MDRKHRQESHSNAISIYGILDILLLIKKNMIEILNERKIRREIAFWSMQKDALISKICNIALPFLRCEIMIEQLSY